MDSQMYTYPNYNKTVAVLMELSFATVAQQQAADLITMYKQEGSSAIKTGYERFQFPSLLEYTHISLNELHKRVDTMCTKTLAN